MHNLERFIIGQGESGRMYVTHTRAPRFVAELFDEGERFPPGGVSMSIAATGETLTSFMWFDDPAEFDLDALRRDVESFIDETDFRAEREVER